jgi:transcriptional regulator with XRE-family HTH domain
MFYWRTKQRMGKILKMKRIEVRISQESIAFETSIDRMRLSAIENGKANPTLFTLLKLCCALHIKLWRVLKEINV